MTKSGSVVQLGKGVADNAKLAINSELSDIDNILITIVSDHIKKRIQGINLDELFSKKNQTELMESWSNQLAEKGLVPHGYSGLSDELLIDNLQQTGECT